MKTKAPSSMNRFAAARPMPVAPPVITAVFPVSLFISSNPFFAVPGPWLSREGFESLNIGSLESGGECGIAHIGGAKRIQPDDCKVATIARYGPKVLGWGFGRRSLRRENAP